MSFLPPAGASVPYAPEHLPTNTLREAVVIFTFEVSAWMMLE